jgi:hypothetical protein
LRGKSYVAFQIEKKPEFSVLIGWRPHNQLGHIRTAARNAAVGSMGPGPIRRGMLGSGRHARGGHATIIDLGTGQSSDV